MKRKDISVGCVSCEDIKCRIPCDPRACTGYRVIKEGYYVVVMGTVGRTSRDWRKLKDIT